VSALSAQTLITVAGTDFRDASAHKVSGSCTPVPSSVNAPPYFVGPLPVPFTISSGAYSISLLPGSYTVTCTLKYATQTSSISMNWVIPSTAGPYRIDQVATTNPSGNQFTILAQQLAPGGVDGQTLVKDSTAPTGQKWATAVGAAGVTCNGATVTWP
jgi:hypothetical protein